jgi:hypothetical protein
MYFASLVLWIAGNGKIFLDSTQVLLLRVLTLDAIALGVFSLAGIGTLIILPDGHRQGYRGIALLMLGIGGYLLLILLAVAGILFGVSLTVIASGTG